MRALLTMPLLTAAFPLIAAAQREWPECKGMPPLECYNTDAECECYEGGPGAPWAIPPDGEEAREAAEQAGEAAEEAVDAAEQAGESAQEASEASELAGQALEEAGEITEGGDL